MLKKVPDKVASLLDGRDVAVADLDSIRDAVANFDNAGALKKLDLEEKRILQNIASGDPVPSLALLTPVLFYPFSKTLFLAIDLAVRPAAHEDHGDHA